MAPCIQTASGGELDPLYISASNLVRLGEGEFTAVMQWVTEQRAARAEATRVREEEQAKAREAIMADVEARAAATAALKERAPWKFD